MIRSEFPLLRRLGWDLDRFFDRLGIERPAFEPIETAWVPDIEMLERSNELVVRADVPGLKGEEISVELSEQELTIKGERKRQKEEKAEGFYRSERSYGTFVRTIALPEGVKTDQAKAIVHDGVLEVKMPLARTEAKKRRLEIAEGSPEKPEKSSKHAA